MPPAAIILLSFAVWSLAHGTAAQYWALATTANPNRNAAGIAGGAVGGAVGTIAGGQLPPPAAPAAPAAPTAPGAIGQAAGP